MAKYIELDKLLNDICKNTEPFNVASVIRTIHNQPTLNINDCENCVFELECDTDSRHCNSFMTPEEYWDEWKKHKDGGADEKS